MLDIIDFKARKGRWSLDEKYESVGKCFWNRGQLCRILDIVDDSCNPVLVRVVDAKGNIKKQVGWNSVQAGDVAIDWENGNTAKTLLSGPECDQYQEMVDEFMDFLHGNFNKPVEVENKYKVLYDELAETIHNYGLEFKKYTLNGQEYKVLVPIN